MLGGYGQYTSPSKLGGGNKRPISSVGTFGDDDQINSGAYHSNKKQKQPPPMTPQ